MALFKKLLPVSLFWPVSLLAADINYSAGLTLVHYTNINHEENPSKSELAQSAFGTVSVIEDTAELVTNLNARVEYTDYVNDLASDQNSLAFLGNALWYLVPGQFEWFMSDTFTQASINILGSDTPDNRQNTNAFSTGPNYIMHFSNRNTLMLEARVKEFYFEEAEINNQRLNGAARWQYALNSAIDIELNYEKEDVNYEINIINSDYVRDDVFFGFKYHRNINTVEANAGYSRISSDTGLVIEENRYLFRLQNQRTRTSTVSLVYESVLSDASTDLQQIVNPNDPTATPIMATSELYIGTSLNLIYSSLLSFGSFMVDIEKSNSDYLTADVVDNDSKGIIMNLLWDIGGRSSVVFDARYLEKTFLNFVPQRLDKDSQYAVTFQRSIGRNLILSLRTENSERDSTESSENYNAIVTMLTLEYTLM